MTTVIDGIVTSLKSAGYIVNVTPQEKQMMDAKEIVIILGEIEVDVETGITYVVRPGLVFRWQDTSIDGIIGEVVKIMKKVEKGMTSNRPFSFGTPKITLLGTAYMVELPFNYTDIVDVST